VGGAAISATQAVWAKKAGKWSIILGALILAYTAWGYFTPEKKLETVTVRVGGTDALVAVQGTVEAARDVDLGFEGSGKVVWVGVTVGQSVRAGQSLATLSQGDLSAQIASLVAIRDAAKIKLEDLKKGTRAEDIAVAEAQLASAQSQALLAQNTLADTLNDAYPKLDDAVRSKTDIFFSNPKSTSPQFTVIATDSQIKIRLESERLALESALNSLQLKTFTSPSAADVTEVRDLTNRVRSYLDTISSAINLAKGYTSLTDAQIDAYKATVSSARISISGYISAITAAQTSSSNLTVAVKTAESQLAQKKAGATSEDIRGQEAQIRAANANIAAIQAQAVKRTITAPFAGQVTKVDVKVGKIASSSDVISLISNTKLQVETFVPEVYIAKIVVGDTANSTLDAYGSQEVFKGKVSSIEPSSTIKDGVSTYKVIISLDTADSKVRPGMGGDISIQGTKGLPVVTIPKKSVISRNGKDYVQIPAAEGSAVKVIEREIVVGKYNEADIAEITDGLSDGDVIVVDPIK
jgi:RND family efflux transporter MFP subunit